MLNTAIFDPWQRSLFSRQQTVGKEPLLAGKNNRGLGKGYQPKPKISLSLRLRLITPTPTSIILDITKTSSNNCLEPIKMPRRCMWLTESAGKACEQVTIG